MREPAAGLAQGHAYDRRTGTRPVLDGEQLVAVKAIAPVVALAAGAGSGKTTVLVERFLNFVTNDGVSPLNILAITYTEKAAAEMKERIVRRFEQHGDDRNRRRAEAAYISTIHGFCARLLRENPLAAGIDPAFEIVDAMRLGFFLDEERARMLEDEWFLDVRGMFSARGRSQADGLFELVKDCVFQSREFGKGIPEEESWDVDQHVAAAMRRLDDFCAGSWRAIRNSLSSISGTVESAIMSGAKSVEQRKRLCEMLALLSSLDAFDPAWADEFCTLTGFTRGVKEIEVRNRIKAVIGPARDAVKLLLGVDRAFEEELERDEIAPLKAGIYRHARELRNRYEQMKAEQSLLDFEDLQRLALRLLGNAEIRAEYGSRFKHILLDEAQDTNQVQKSIIDALGQEHDRCLFAVGDPKQSVYGFRGADVSLFNDMHRSAGDGRLQLQDNYRSRPEIIDFVNAASALMWRDGDVIEYTPLVCKSRYEKGATASPRVEMMFVEKQQADPANGRDKADDSAAAHEREALAIAMRIRAIVEGTGGAPPVTVYDRHSKTYRNASYGDIAILASGRTHFAVYERVLSDIGIPVVADGGGGFFSGREVKDLLAALRVVANRYDEVALLAALRSPLFGWSDEDLVSLRVAGPGGLWRAFASGFVPHGESADPHAYATLAALQQLRQALPPARLVQLLLDRTGYAAALLRTRRGRPGVANVGKLLEFARQSASVDGPDLRRFIRRAELAEDYLAQEREASIAAEGEDVVLLSTIHGSKGLEWPVVILASLDSRFNRSDSGSFYSPADETLVLEPKGADGVIRKPLSQRPVTDARKARDEQEGRRLFYVGMTRAREQLILSGVHTPPDEQAAIPDTFGAPVKWLCAAAGVTTANCSSSDLSIGNAVVSVNVVREESVAAARGAIGLDDPRLVAARRSVEGGEPVTTWKIVEPQRRARIEIAVRELLERDVVPLAPEGARQVTTVTNLVYFARCPLVYYFNLVLQIEEHPRKRRESKPGADRRYSAVELGTAVHEMLERAEFDAEPAEEARRLVNGAGSGSMPPQDRDRVERMLANVLADPLIDRARTAIRLEREYPFYLAMNGTLVHGVIDLVFTDASGRGVVVDYKSNDLAAPDRVNVLSRYYEPQIRMYALAATRAGIVQADEATLYFLNKSVATRFDVDTAQQDIIAQQMSEALTHISQGDWDTEPGEKCRHCGYRARGFCEVGKRFVE